MKNLLSVLSLIITLVGCKGFHVDPILTQKEVVKSENQTELEPMADLTGYWEYQNGDYKDIILIQSTWDDKESKFETKTLGIDLFPDFKIRTSAYASDDNPILQFNDKTIESLLVRTQNGVKSVITFEYLIQNHDTLKMKITSASNSVTRKYTRIQETAEIRRNFRDLQFIRSKQILDNELKAYDQKTCLYFGQNQQYEDIIEHRENTCLQMLIENKLVDLDKDGLLHFAVYYKNADLVSYLLKLGANPNINHPFLGSVINTLTSDNSRTQEWHLIDHGGVTIASDVDAIFTLLMENGFDLNNSRDSISSLLILFQKPKSLELLLETNPEIKLADLRYFLIDYKYRWGTDGSRLLSRVLKLIAPQEQSWIAEEFDTVTSIMLNLDTSGLLELNMHGVRMSGYAANIGKIILGEKIDSLASDKNLSRAEKQKRIEEIENLKKNIEWVKANLKK